MTSQTGQQKITIHILPSISRSRGNQAMKFGQLMKYSMRNNFPQNHSENEIARLVSDLFLFFKKALYKVKASGNHLNFNVFW